MLKKFNFKSSYVWVLIFSGGTFLKYIEFNEEQFSDLQNIGEKLLYSVNDPRSSFYVRKLNRPKIDWQKILIYIFSPIILILLSEFIMYKLNVDKMICIAVPISFLFIYMLLTAKSAIICIIKIYQRYAPDSIRNKCRFEPSCSEYTILSIKKEGLIKGLIRSFHRLKRCNINDGGFDYP